MSILDIYNFRKFVTVVWFVKTSYCRKTLLIFILMIEPSFVIFVVMVLIYQTLILSTSYRELS